MSALRTKEIIRVGKRQYKTDFYCVRCEKDLKPAQPVRWVHCIDGHMAALHPADESKYVSDGGEMGCWPLGIDCARALGLEWSIPETRALAELRASKVKQ